MLHNRWSHSARCAAYAISAALAACGGAGTPGFGPAATDAALSRSGAARADSARSWMAPNAKSQSLLYVSDAATYDVYVYTYPGGKPVGTLTGFAQPSGLCADKAGDVFVTNFGDQNIVEYAHGGTEPIATLDDQLYAPEGCSVDDATGNLAVTNFCKMSGNDCIGPGDIAIYKHATGMPVLSSVASIPYVFFCSYDPHGDLFVDGETSLSGRTFQLAERAKGQRTFQGITLDRLIYWPGGVQWDGKYLAVGDQEAGGKFASSVHQVNIKEPKGTVVSTTRLQGAVTVAQFWIQNANLIAPNEALKFASSGVRFYTYPSGGAPTKNITGDFEDPEGATVSSAGE